MRQGLRAATGVAIIALTVASAASRGVAAQGQARAARPIPRTPSGRPDLDGIWNFSSLTPLQRPDEFAGKEVLSDAEAAEFERQTLERTNADRRTPGSEADVATGYNDFWYDRGTRIGGTQRTSLIVDPPDGKLPALTADAQKSADARADIRQRAPRGPEDRSLSERCLVFNAGPPILPGPYNNNLQLFQTREMVVVLSEMIHDARIIPLDGRPHLANTVRQWLGDSRGHWEGEALVVDTTNFNAQTAFRGADQNLHLVERFQRIDAGTLLYEFTVDDPTAFTRPWSVSLRMTRSDEPIYEYACHEGNYGMVGMLKGARAQEDGAPPK